MPYKSSNLTKIMKNALGGNSKTFMLCTLRPGAKYFESTLNTLRCADQFKHIKITASVYESKVEKMINLLQNENDKLEYEITKK